MDQALSQRLGPYLICVYCYGSHEEIHVDWNLYFYMPCVKEGKVVIIGDLNFTLYRELLGFKL